MAYSTAVALMTNLREVLVGPRRLLLAPLPASASLVEGA